MTRTPTLPATDQSMWRRLLARTHPDAGGDHELFIWAGSLKDHVCNGTVTPRPEPASPQRSSPGPSTEEPARVRYPPDIDFREATRRVLSYGASRAEDYSWLLGLLADCSPLAHMWREQERGASYKRLAAIGHMAGMDVAERSGWYRVAEEIPLSDRHAGHILSRLKRGAA
jgi:hypothetical protein